MFTSHRMVLLMIVLPTAMPAAARAQSFLDRLGNVLNSEESGEAAPAPATAEITRAQPRTSGPGYLGLTGDEIEGETGVFVAEVEVGTPADRAGFQPGDRITQIGDMKISSMQEMARLLQKKKAGERIVFLVDRAGAQKKITATLSARPAAAPVGEDGEEVPLPEDAAAVESAPGPLLGITAAPITDELRDRYGITAEEGAVIAGIQPGSPAHRQRLPIGAVIVDVNGTEIKTPEQLQEMVAAANVGDELEFIFYVGDQRSRAKVRLAPPLPDPPGARRAARPADEPREGLGLEDRLGEGGRRPVLGRLGRVLDEMVDDDLPPDIPAEDAEPVAADENAGQPPPSDEVTLLREEVELLRREVDLLRRRLDELDRKLKK